MGLEGARFKPWEMPVSQFGGIHIDAPQLVSILSFENVKDYEDYIARLRLLPRLFDQTMEQMRKGLAAGLMPPKILLDKVVTQADGIATTAADQSPFTHPFDKFPDAVPEADRKRLREAGLAAVKESVIPAYVKFTAFVRDEYAPKAERSPEPGLCPTGPLVCVPRKRKHDDEPVTRRDSSTRAGAGERDRRPHARGGESTRLQGHEKLQSGRGCGSEAACTFTRGNPRLVSQV